LSDELRDSHPVNSKAQNLGRTLCSWMQSANASGFGLWLVPWNGIRLCLSVIADGDAVSYSGHFARSMRMRAKVESASPSCFIPVPWRVAEVAQKAQMSW